MCACVCVHACMRACACTVEAMVHIIHLTSEDHYCLGVLYITIYGVYHISVPVCVLNLKYQTCSETLHVEVYNKQKHPLTAGRKCKLINSGNCTFELVSWWCSQ